MKEIEIPEGYKARIEGNRVILEPVESEDEMRRKEIIDYLSNELHNVKQLTPRTNEIESWIAYLEKQKEQKSELYDIDILEKHITKDSISELAHTVIIRNGWEIVEKGQKPANVDYISGIRDELLGIEDNAKNVDGLTDSQWVAIRAAHRLLGEYLNSNHRPAGGARRMRKY